MTATGVTMNPEKLARLQEQAKAGATSSIRRKTVKKTPTAVQHDDKKLQQALGRLRAQPIPGIDEVNMFDEEGRVIHFSQPRVQGAISSNTFCVSGHHEEKELTELLPGILSQLGAESLEALRKMAQAMQAQNQDASGADGDGIPDLVEDFEAAEIGEKDVTD